MDDLIKRADAIEAVAQQWLFEASVGNPYVNDDDIGAYRTLAENLFKDVPSAETHEIRTETHGVCLISKADAIETVCRTRCGDKAKGCPAHSCLVIEEFDALPSAEMPTESTNTPTNTPTDLISRADALALFYPDTQYWGDDIDNKLLSLPSAEAVPQSEQYKKGFEDAKRAFELEYARESENMRKRNAQLEVMLNAQKAISPDAVQGVGRYENAMQKLREMPKYLNGVKAKQIKKIPSDAVQGEWQKVEEQSYFRKHYDTVCCSVCRKKGNRKWNFCPSCGARMKGGAE